VDTTRADSTRSGRAGVPGLTGLLGLAALTGAAITALIGLSLLGVRTDPSAPPAAPSEADSASGAAAAMETRGQGFAFWGTAQDGGPLRWDACAPVRFLLSTPEAPEHAERDLRTALEMLADASGLDLVLLGTTEERPSADRALVERDGDGWRWRPVLVAWAAPGATDLPLTPVDRGVALPVAVRDGGREGYVTGQVVINSARDDLVPGFSDRRDAIGATLVHEVGHILGLDHVDDVTQLMSADPGSGPVRFGEGDLRGLRALGADAGCRPAPPATSGRGLVAQP
jgi:hypothetical protein